MRGSRALGDLIEIVGGGTPTRTVAEFYGGGIPWVTPKDMKRWNISSTQVTLTRMGVECSPAKLIDPGAVLLVVRSGILKHTLPVALNRVPVALNQDMKALICGPGLDPDYLARFLKWRSPEVLSWVRATTADNFPVASLREMEIPLPPLAEQRRVAAILDQADAVSQRCLGQLDAAGALAAGIFREMFGDLLRNERGWRPGVVGDLVASFESGKNIIAGSGDAGDGHFRVLRVSAITTGVYQSADSKSVPSGYSPPAHHLVKEGDLLFGRANTEALVGATAFAVGVLPGTLLPDKIWRFVWPRGGQVEPRFVDQLFRSPSFRRELSRRSSGTSGSMKNVSQAKVMTIPIGIPPVSMQREFALVAERTSQLVGRLSQKHRAVVELAASFQDRAFKGEL